MVLKVRTFFRLHSAPFSVLHSGVSKSGDTLTQRTKVQHADYFEIPLYTRNLIINVDWLQ